MKIKQLYCGFSNHFKDALVKKYGFEDYQDNNEPLFMFGCYNDGMLKLALRRKGLVVICWAGTDAKMLADGEQLMKMDATPARRFFSWGEILRGFPNIKHIAMSKFIADDLDKCGLPYLRHPVFVHNVEDYTPVPLGDSIFMYQPSNPIYNGKGLYYELQNILPYHFIEVSAHTFNRAELLDAYRRSFIGLRFTRHDGMNHTGCELGLMGRRQIYNGDLPNAISFEDIEGIVKAINAEYGRLNDWLYVGNEMREYLDRGDAFLHTGFYT